ncbi:MAG: hypothetical protein ACQESE_05125 [Nanobdellota archaeon]
MSILHILAIITALLPALISGRWYWKRKGSRVEHIALSIITLFIVNGVIALILGIIGALSIEGILIGTALADGAMYLFEESKNL